MEEKSSILISIKKLLGISKDYKNFDTDIIMHINTVFTVLNQLGVGPSEGYMIENEKDEWSDFIDESAYNFNSIKSYIHLKVKLLFDPPTSSTVMEAIKESIKELEWRLNIEAESTESE